MVQAQPWPTALDLTIAPHLLRETAIVACRAAADVIGQSSARSSIATKSTSTDIVTATDLAAEQVVRDVIARAVPGSTVLGEEGGHETAGKGPHVDIEWVVDPLDGTVNFSYGIPICSVSVAAVAGGRPVAGAVIDVVRSEMFSAHLGGGAHLGDEPIQVNTCDDPSLALGATGFAYDAERRLAHAATVSRMLGRLRDVRAFGSAALQLCWVAAGRVDVYFERDIRPWDHCAGGLIASEAGALVELGCPENDRLVIAAHPGLCRALRSAMT